MSPRAVTDLKAFEALEQHIAPYEAKGRARSAALLIWFLTVIYRVDEIEAQDAVCDATDDKGIDGLFVSDEQQQIIIFQSKRREKPTTTAGDSDLRKFVGTMALFRNHSTIDNLANTTRNPEVRRLIRDNEVAAKRSEGYALRFIYCTNVAAEKVAHDYVESVNTGQVPLELWDLRRLAGPLAQLHREWFVDDPCELSVTPGKYFVEGDAQKPRVVFAALSATSLVKLPGIEDFRLFAQNVRLDIGRTRVNKDIARAVNTKREHMDFLTFHNGLTIVAREMRLASGVLSLKHYSVCNGCQSLLSFYRNRSQLTKRLEVLVRIVRIGTNRDLASAIAHRTNNQNAIALRDLSSNDPVQMQIESDFNARYGDEAIYVVKRGAPSDKLELPNEVAGQLLLSFYGQAPWSAHKKGQIFGELYGSTFRFGLNAPHVRLAHLAMGVVEDALARLSSERIRKYGLTRYMMLYLLGEVLRQQSAGRELLEDPAPYLCERKGKRKMAQRMLLRSLKTYAIEISIECEYYFSAKGDGYDYKSEFKSRESVLALRAEVMKSVEKDLSRGRVPELVLPAR